MNASTVITRFAPSPTGRLHLRNLRTALVNGLYAGRNGGRLLLRIEDTDSERSEKRYLAGLLEDLAWLGLRWDAGPDGVGADYIPPQSQRGAVYADHYQRVLDAGHAYHCFCTAAELAEARRAQRAAGRPPRYPGTCAPLDPQAAHRRTAAGEPATLRFRVPAVGEVRFDDLPRGPQAFACADIGDFIIRRVDGSAAFFFGNALDDALMGVTHVLRGEDHLANTPRQLLLLDALGLPHPAYAHFGLIAGSDGAPLSKRNGSRSVADLRDAGYLPEALLNYLARLGHAGLDDELADLAGLASGFDLTRVGRGPARFDPAQLDHWQSRALQARPSAALAAWLPDASPVPAPDRPAFLELIRPNVRFPADVAAWGERLYGEWTPEPSAREALITADPALFEAALTAWSRHGRDWQTLTAALCEATGLGGRRLFQPLRAALTGATHGPELAGVLALLPAATIETRLRAAREIAEGGFYG